MGMPLESLTVLQYQEIIDGVVGRVKPSFNEEGVDESVLDEVRALWEAKLVATGVVGEPSNVGQQVILQQRLQHGPPQLQQLHTAAPHYLAVHPGFHSGMHGLGMPQMMAAAAAPQMMSMAMPAQAQAVSMEQKRKLDDAEAAKEAPNAKLSRNLPQLDGPADDSGHEVVHEVAQGALAAAGEAKDEDDDDPLSEDDEDGSGDELDEAAVVDVVLGQFEKVQRTKNKWKVVLKDCILTLNSRDYLVRRCTGEMEF